MSVVTALRNVSSMPHTLRTLQLILPPSLFDYSAALWLWPLARLCCAALNFFSIVFLLKEPS